MAPVLETEVEHACVMLDDSKRMTRATRIPAVGVAHLAADNLVGVGILARFATADP